ncbi:MAG: OmpA family protein, partial [Lachnospiraceae bacterium]|nr:OmpA family protein [Lachnospiraceae bacterium]
MFKSRRRRARAQDEETVYWLSYSDMMAGLLLVFVLIIGVTMLRAQVQFDLKQNELLGKEQELMVQTDALELERETVASQKLILDDQKETLALQEEQLIAQQERLATQEEMLRQQHILLSDLEELMATQQAQLDKLIGVRSELVQELKREFDDSDLQISVDEQTGGITFNSSILFSFNRDDLKDSGKEFLSEFLPRYVKILLGPKYREYISEISIEGNTDTNGDYLYNLELSQKRAMSVAEYCLSDGNGILTGEQLEALRAV